ncbi:WxL protein peptidoglycan domain-containing protein [Microbacterium resistens]
MNRTPFAARAALVLVLAGSAALTTAPAAAAAETPADEAQGVAWSMTPVITAVGEERTNFAYAVDPGARIDDAVLVRNSGSTELVLAVQGAGGETTSEGALDFARAGDETPADAIGSWIAPATESVTIAPGAQARIPFSVTVPADAAPGEHAGALLTVRQQTGDVVSVDMRYATRVTVAVSGELTAGLGLSDTALQVRTGFWPWEPASAQVGYAVTNTGNTRLSGPQQVDVQGVAVTSVTDGSTGVPQLSELLPHAAVRVDARIDGIPAWSPFFTASIAVAPTVLTTVSGDVPVVEQATARVTAVAVAPGTWVLAALLVGIPILVLLRWRRRGAGTRTPAPVPADTEPAPHL